MDIFQGLEGKRLVIFGSGRYADQFLALYGKRHPVDFILDNCIKDYLSVLRQLDEMGIKDYAIFDPSRDYPRVENTMREPVQAADEEAEGQKPKKYHVGYIAGVFDLFHIGHLNMFRRAKEQCEHLIVGVVSDAGVRKYKEVEPFIPFDERVEIVRSCRYVDEAVEIPENYGGTRDAWRMYHFDVQFSGSDYVNDTSWLAEKEFLEKHGATMVFFPYTEQTSSTKIKALIEQRLEKIAIGKYTE